MRTKKKQHRSKSSSTALVDLTTAEVKGLAKPRDGFGTYVDALIALYVDNGGDMPGFDPEVVRTELAESEALTSTAEEQRTALDLTIKTRALHASNAWRGTMQLYKWALLVGHINPAVMRGIARFEQFMKRGPRKAHVTPTTPVTPVVIDSGSGGSAATSSA